MLNYSLGFCQIKKIKMVIFFICCFAVASLTLSCSTNKAKDENSKIWTTIQGEAKWFLKNPLYSYTDQEGETYTNPFFDLVPFVDYEDLLTDFYVINPARSQEIYSYDLSSGRRYFDHNSCSRDDAYNKYKGTVSSPNFTLGIVPRILNQVGQPLQIMVFGNESFYQEDHGTAVHQARVVGGIVLRYCNIAYCSESDSEEYLVLVAVDPRDSKLSNVKHIKDLKQNVDFKYSLAYWNNFLMVKQSGKQQFYPSYKVINEVGPYTAYKKGMTKKLILKGDELEKIRLNCLKLYQKAWDNLGSIKYQKEKTSTEKEIAEESRKFAEDFINFYEKYGNEYLTCSKYVKSTAGGKNYKMHSFFVYFDAFFKLLQLGYVYDCETTNFRNKTHGITSYLELKKEIRKCSAKEIDVAFSRAKVYMNYLRNGQMRHYRYIEYDNGVFGTHDKLYSWVLDEGKILNCNDGKSDAVKNVLPEKVDWPLFKNYHNQKFKVKK